VFDRFEMPVQLCHAFRHWKQRVRDTSVTPPRQYAEAAETAQQFKKRREEWRRELRQRETHMHRAGYLADDKLANMSYLIGPADEGKPDWALWWAARLAIGRALQKNPRGISGPF
jgi:hypothetical protein